MHSHQLYAANLMRRTTATAIFDLAWEDPEPEAEPEEGTRRRRRPVITEAPGLRDLHDTILLYGDVEIIQAWGAKLAEAAGIESINRPPTWALSLAPLLAEVPEAVDDEPVERTNGHLVDA